MNQYLFLIKSWRNWNMYFSIQYFRSETFTQKEKKIDAVKFTYNYLFAFLYSQHNLLTLWNLNFLPLIKTDKLFQFILKSWNWILWPETRLLILHTLIANYDYFISLAYISFSLILLYLHIYLFYFPGKAKC